MDQSLRNKLRGAVTQCRKLLEDSTAQALQGRFGIYASHKKGGVQVDDDTRMSHLTDADRACRQDLLDHLAHIQAIGYKPSETLEQLVREIAFTHLNRLCAYKMMESRGLIREAVSRGFKSQGFFFYLADHPDSEKLHNSGQQDMAYRKFLDWLGGMFSQEIGVLFNPNDPANRIYPPQRVLDEVLALINDDELQDIWSQDETIGWVYQYFTPKELRDKARKESQAPRNSYELAFRNQFFTPRYVVEFLTDNTLGRIWYEMRRGKTVLKDHCKYMVRRPREIFLTEAEQPPAESVDAHKELSQEELLKQPVFIPHRAKKDPRALKILDPAGGSGHFLLYCFDLLQIIYEEAYDDPDLSAALRTEYPAIEDLRCAVPGLILKHNLHGIDIDLRATQIAAIALWLRCQRAYQEMGLKNGERPKITRSNLVCAEPMPGETDLLKEFTATLQPKVLGQLVETVFEKMKLAGEAGSLLKIEEEIRVAASRAKFDFIQWKKHQDKAKGSLFPELVERNQPSIFDFTDMTDEVFLDRAEDEIVAALRQYAEKASNGKGFRRRLFAEDAVRGFSFVDLCSKKYDVVLMNPPYGGVTERMATYLKLNYLEGKNDIFLPFVERGIGLGANGELLGALTSRNFMFNQRMADFRKDFLLTKGVLVLLADLGNNVLDAAVDVAAFTLCKGPNLEKFSAQSVFFNMVNSASRSNDLQKDIEAISCAMQGPRVFQRPISFFFNLPDYRISYSAPDSMVALFGKYQKLAPAFGLVLKGLITGDDERYVRAWQECPASPEETRWKRFHKGGDYAPFYSDVDLMIDWGKGGAALKADAERKYGSASRTIKNELHFGKPGLAWGVNNSIGFAAKAIPSGCVFADIGPMFQPTNRSSLFLWMGFLNSFPIKMILRLFQSGDRGRFMWIANIIEQIPCPGDSTLAFCAEPAKQATQMFFKEASQNECSPLFIRFVQNHLGELDDLKSIGEFICEGVRDKAIQLQKICSIIDSAVGDAFSDKFLDADDIRALITKQENPSEAYLKQFGEVSDAILAARLLSYAVGSVLGRWDIRFATGERQPPELPDPFDPLPVCPPGMLQGRDGLPAKPEDIPSDFPIRIDWDGILVDDPGHEEDIIRRVQNVMEVLWKDRAEAIEQEACEILGVRELRDYFRKPGNGGFWMDHVKRYSKSRRKAPIYWYLRSAKGNYGLWLYYHRLDKDILFKALLNYVEPKIRLEEDRLKSFRGRKEAVGSSGREAKQLENDMDRQEQFVSELHDFADKIRRAANLHLMPDLNDGVVLNIAPLFELLPWKEAKDYWEDLAAGKYEWSSIGKQLRDKGLVKIQEV